MVWIALIRSRKDQLRVLAVLALSLGLGSGAAAQEAGEAEAPPAVDGDPL